MELGIAIFKTDVIIFNVYNRYSLYNTNTVIIIQFNDKNYMKNRTKRKSVNLNL